MAEPVLLFGSARTGSSFVVGTLRNHPEVLAHGEPFQTENLEWHFDPRVLPLVDFSFRERSPYQFIRWLYRHSLGNRFVVLKILFGQNDETLWRLVRDLDIHAIYLRRPNRLAHFVSYELAYQTNVWNANSGERVDQAARVHFDPEKFRKFVNWQNRCEDSVEKIIHESGRTYFACDYDPAQLTATARNVASWLGIDQSVMVESSLIRLRASPIVERFSNPEAVMGALATMNKLEWAEE
ncbi:MAG TPA: hypothetical protein VGF97_13880 [Rhizomicrobium sp.]|jgi:hypothetical protein